MKVTSMRIRLLDTGNRMVGVVSLTLDNMIAIHDIKILNGAEGLFLAMPSKSLKNGTFRDIAHPINATVRESIENMIFAAYQDCLNNDYQNVQFDVYDHFNKTLVEQTFDHFHVSSDESDEDIKLTEEVKASEEDDHSKKNRHNIFFNLFNK